jgi:hypothetical protein
MRVSASFFSRATCDPRLGSLLMRVLLQIEQALSIIVLVSDREPGTFRTELAIYVHSGPDKSRAATSSDSDTQQRYRARFEPRPRLSC